MSNYDETLCGMPITKYFQLSIIKYNNFQIINYKNVFASVTGTKIDLLISGLNK